MNAKLAALGCMIFLAMPSFYSCGDKDARARHELKAGIELMHQSAPDRALPHFTKAIEYKADFAEAFYYRGNALMNLQDYEGAMSDYNEAIRFNSEYADAYFNRGSLWAILGNRDSTCADYKRAMVHGRPNVADKVRHCP